MTKRILITGSNRGLGKGIARFLHEEGCQITSLNRTLANEDWLNEIKCDLTDEKQIDYACNLAIDKFKGIDVCICNAATRKLSLIENMETEDWNDSVLTNLSSVFFVCRNLIPELKKTKGYFFIIGSQASDYFFETGAAYCATKAALKAFTEVLIMENRKHGIRVSLINAGAIKNRPKKDDEWKMKPYSIAALICQLMNTDPGFFVSELELRPTAVPVYPLFGMERIQAL